jgi:hypothetical protein
LQAKLMRRQRIWQIRVSDSPLENLTSFALSEDTGDAILGTQGGMVSAMSTLTEPSANARMLEPQTTVTRFTSRVTSISLSTDESKRLVCCSSGNDHTSGTIHIGHIRRNEDDRHWYGLDVHCVLKPRDKQALYSSTISRYTSGLTAVGAEKVVFVADEKGDQQPLIRVNSAAFAVEFLGEHTLAAGTRFRAITYVCD